MDVPSPSHMNIMLNRQIDATRQNPIVINTTTTGGFILQRFDAAMQQINPNRNNLQQQHNFNETLNRFQPQEHRPNVVRGDVYRPPPRPSRADVIPPRPGDVYRPPQEGDVIRPLQALQANRRRVMRRDTTIETAEGRRHTQSLLQRHFVAMARTCVTILRSRLPTYESKIQSLMGEPNSTQDDNDTQIATLVMQCEQANIDIDVMRSLYRENHRNGLTPIHIETVIRVMTEQYEELNREIANDPPPPPPPLEIDDDDDDDAGNGAEYRNVDVTAAGMFAALLGAAVGPQLQNGNPFGDLLQAIGGNLPENFFDDVPVPMPAESLQQMPSTTYREFVEKFSGDEQPNTDCNFCLEQFKEDDQVRAYPCCPRVPQHTSCLESWVATHDTCIICKQKIPDVLNNNNSRN